MHETRQLELSGLDSGPRKILVLDAHPETLSQIHDTVTQMGYNMLSVREPAAGIQMANRENPDLILVDIGMLQNNGQEVSRQLKENPHTADIPIIILSIKDEIEDKIAAVELGAVDFITKPIRQEEIRVRVAIVMEMVKMQEKLLSKAYSDELTGLTNRRRLMEILGREVMLVKSQGRPLSLLILDIDHFKKLNDTYGHMGGDRVLKQLATILRENVKPLDVVARYGGEEFVIVMPDTSCDEAARAGDRIRRRVRDHDWEISSERVHVTISLGLDSVDAKSAIQPDELLQSADAALYEAKERGRNRLVRWDHIDITRDQVILDYAEYQQIEAEIDVCAATMRMEIAREIYKSIEKKLAWREPYARYHLRNVETYACTIARNMKLDDAFLEKLIVATRLYNLGRISIPRSLLHKEGQLTSQERQIVEQLPLVSLKLLEPLRGIFGSEFPIIRHRCECFDGTGFPDGLRGSDIPIGSRILAVAESFNAITSERPYQSSSTLAKAQEELARCAGSEFDPEVVAIFNTLIGHHHETWPLSHFQDANEPALNR